MSDDLRRKIFSETERIVVKIGTAALTDEQGRLDKGSVARLCGQVSELRKRGLKVIVVTSGAIGAGMAELKMSKRPTALPLLQAAASVGQGKLVAAYDESLRKRGYHAAQILLTREDFEHRKRYLNARNTIFTLLELGAIPIINENDTISVDEITFSDNDILSALVATMVRADALIILSTVKGLYRGGKVVDIVERVDDSIRELATGAKTRLGVGGMESKLEAAAIATRAGVPVVLADGTERDSLLRAVSGERVGTLFLPLPQKISSRKGWIGLTVRPRGKIYVDEGAYRAVARRGKSLLPSGIVRVEGKFERGDVVSIVVEGGGEFARGLVNYSSGELDRIKGLRTSQIRALLGTTPYDEAIHRDNLVVIT